MLIAAIIALCAIIAAYAVLANRRRKKFDAERTARMRARRQRWAEWLDGKGPEPPHEETWAEYQERKRR